METGLLWYDDDPSRGLENKVEQAARRYHEKYGRWPNTCYVHPQVVADHLGPELQVVCSGKQQRVIRVVSAPNVLPHHYWLGETTGESSRQFAKASA